MTFWNFLKHITLLHLQVDSKKGGFWTKVSEWIVDRLPIMTYGLNLEFENWKIHYLVPIGNSLYLRIMNFSGWKFLNSSFKVQL